MQCASNLYLIPSFTWNHNQHIIYSNLNSKGIKHEVNYIEKGWKYMMVHYFRGNMDDSPKMADFPIV